MKKKSAIKIAIIPARGGSKRLPRKNILPLPGGIMIEFPISAALRSGLFDHVVVSTEDNEIAEISKKAGAEIVYRPSNLAKDSSTVAEVCLHTLKEYPSDYFCCVYATASLLNSEILIDSYKKFKVNLRADVLMGVSAFNYPPAQALRMNDYGFLEYMWPEFKGVQSQNQPVLCVSNGTFVWSKTNEFKKNKTFYSSSLMPYYVDPEHVQDVDTMDDYLRLMERMKVNENRN